MKMRMDMLPFFDKRDDDMTTSLFCLKGMDVDAHIEVKYIY